MEEYDFRFDHIDEESEGKWGFEVHEFGDGAELVEAVEGMLAGPPPAESSRVSGAAGADSPDSASGLASAVVSPGSRASPSSCSGGIRWPAFVTLDAQMPRMGGSDAMAAIAAIRSRLESAGAAVDAAGLGGVCVIGVTGQAVSEDRDRLSAMGARRVLTKPVAPHELARVVAKEVVSVSLPASAFGRR